MAVLQSLLNNDLDNYILPFFWQHGEDEETLRKYMEVIDNSNIKSVCVESRPHPDFAGDKWWKDLDVIFDEALKRNMKVWILDDSHFPSGYTNGELNKLDKSLRRQFFTKKELGEFTGTFKVLDEYNICPAHEKSKIEEWVMDKYDLIDDDHVLGFVALDENGVAYEVKDGDTLKGTSKIYGLYTTRDRGPHRDFINMIDKKSVRVFIDTVYETHYKKYKDYFGNVLEGFFSDEPELGNGHLYEKGKQLHEIDDWPYSLELEEKLKEKWQDKYLSNLATVFLDVNDDLNRSKCRTEYMDVVTNLVKEDFSYQIGDWCREHGVKYIGHMIEDNNEHSRTGSSLGHFFRGLKGESWAGIDDIGGQVLPQMEDAIIKSKFSGSTRDGVFYHFTLGKLGASAAAIDPLKKGNAMCEIFGNYGWEEGVYLEKYLIDHFMVRGINHFVPHAFSPKPFPDPDCPPHFWAQGNNPQYKHFGYLMSYTNRICNLISNGKAVRKVAVLYHGEADWTGLDYMKEDVVNRILMENHIDFDIIPSDIFYDGEYEVELKDNKLNVGLGEYDVVIVPEYPVIRQEVVEALNSYYKNGLRVYAINKVPELNLNGDLKLDVKVIKLDELLANVEDLKEVRFKGDARFVRYMHYQNNNDVYYFVNEADKTFNSTITMPYKENAVIYDAWNNKVYKLDGVVENGNITFDITLQQRKSLIVYADDTKYETVDSIAETTKDMTNELVLTKFTRSICKGVEYPNFINNKEVELPDRVEEEYPMFGGYIKYKTSINLGTNKAVLLIDDLLEGVEVFVNGESLGIQIVPTYEFDLTPYLKDGENQLEIISATTLERFVEKKSMVPGAPLPEPKNLLGIKGTVKIVY